MTTPFHKVIAEIEDRRYHNHRLEVHSDIVSAGIYQDLLTRCEALRLDVEKGLVGQWLNVRAPGARERKIDLFIGETATGTQQPDIKKLRVCVENKSVITAHRNRDARFDDLNEALQVVHAAKSEAVIVATILVGVATRVLNIPDQVKKIYKGRQEEFKQTVLPRLSSGDESLWGDFAWAVSANKSTDPGETVRKLRMLPTRRPGHTHVCAYDYVLIVPVSIDNVNPPQLVMDSHLGINVDEEYWKMISTICNAYTARWHLE
ncbi:MAG TPA: hypothetical protein VFY60_16815 [Pyrinomonadaceae bacterium]|nr:hypothetical protein [Pyrinomonadaceae bacterium]